MKYKIDTIDDLMASIARTNNGYIFAPSNEELAVALRHKDIVDIRNGQIHKAGVACEYPRKPMHASINPGADYFDYEGAILASQEKYLFY